MVNFFEVISATNIVGFSGDQLINALNIAYRANDDGVFNREAMLFSLRGGEQFLIMDGGSQHIPNSQNNIVIRLIGNVNMLNLLGPDSLSLDNVVLS